MTPPSVILLLDGVAVEQVQRLAEGRADFLAGADALAIAAAEGGEEVVGGLAVGDLHGARAGGQAAEFVLRLGDLADAVEHDLGAHAADGGLGEVAVVERVGFVRTRGELVGARVADVADDACAGRSCTRRSSSRARRAVRGSRRDSRCARHRRARRCRGPCIAPRRGSRCGAGNTDFPARRPSRRGPCGDPCLWQSGASPPRNFGGTTRSPTGCCDSPPPLIEDDLLARVFAVLAADLGEERDEAAVVVHRPAVERMVVALRALDADAEEGLRGVFRELQRVALELVVIGGRILEVRAGGADELARRFR